MVQATTARSGARLAKRVAYGGVGELLEKYGVRLPGRVVDDWEFRARVRPPGVLVFNVDGSFEVEGYEGPVRGRPYLAKELGEALKWYLFGDDSRNYYILVCVEGDMICNFENYSIGEINPTVDAYMEFEIWNKRTGRPIFRGAVVGEAEINLARSLEHIPYLILKPTIITLTPIPS